jgi:hypothetical protein
MRLLGLASILFILSVSIPTFLGNGPNLLTLWPEQSLHIPYNFRLRTLTHFHLLGYGHLVEKLTLEVVHNRWGQVKPSKGRMSLVRGSMTIGSR